GDYVTSVVDTLDFVFTYGSGNCLTRDTMELIVNPLPVVDAGLDFAVCISNPDTLISANFNTGYWYGSPNIDSSGIFSPSNAGVGLHQVIYYYKNQFTLCDNTDTLIIDVKPLPIPNFSNDSIVCKNSVVNFNNQSTGSNLYDWDFNDGSNSNSISPNNIFSDTGVYNVKLTAISFYGCVDSIQITIDVIDPPFAYLSFVDSGCAPLEVLFVNNSYGKYTNYFWDLGNGITSQDTTPPNQIYQQSLITDTTYFISYIISNLCGSDTFIDSINVAPRPTSIFLNNISSGCSPLNVSFFNISVGNPTLFHWDMGDGTMFTVTDSLHNHTFTYNGLYDTIYNVSMIAENYCGSDSSNVDITVYPDQVTAFFTSDSTSGCNPLVINFQNYSIGSNLTYGWDFGDGNFSSSRNVIHTYTTAGSYNVQLVVNDGCSFDTLYQLIEVYPLPQSNFHVQNDTVCGSDTLIFVNLTSGSSFLWDFGDGNSSVLTEPKHNYSNPGTYVVKLTSTTLLHGCSVIDSIEVTSLIQPIANSNLDTNSGCLPINISFVNLSQNSNFYSWNFADGNTSSTVNPIHTYFNTGVFNGNLIAFNINGCSDTANFSVNVDPKPTASFIFNRVDSCVLPANYLFINQSSINCNYEWNFGDSSSSTISNPTNMYQNNGQYLVTLRIENIFGCKDTMEQIINLDTVPYSNFSMDSSAGCIPLSINFNNNSLNSNFYSWDFGDGNFSSNNSPNYTYTTAGNYQIQLVSQDLNGCYDTSYSNITIYPEPTANFLINNSNPCFQPVQLTMSNNSIGSNYFNWDFGNGAISNLTSPSVSLDSIRTYDISLIAGNSFGCEDTMTQNFQIYQQPIADFLTIQDSICYRDSILFSSQCQYQDLVTWNLNGLQFNSLVDTTIMLNSPGFYNLELYASNNNGICIDTIALINGIEVLPSPVADFSLSPTNGCMPLLNVSFTNLSTAANSYFWDFGNGSNSLQLNSIQNYYLDSLFEISLHVENSLGCVDSIFKNLEVFPKPSANFSFTNSDPCIQPAQLIFNNLSSGANTYNWDFGTSITSVVQNPITDYNSPGIYNIELIVENNFGCKDTTEDVFEVYQPPIADFTQSDDTVCVGDSIIFSSQSLFTDSVYWLIGDSIIYSNELFSYDFPDTMVIDISLYTFNNDGCVDSLKNNNGAVSIFSPIANFNFTDTLDPFFPLTGILYLNNYSLNASSYLWEFFNGDISYDSILNYDYQYNTESNYPVILSAINSCAVDTMMLYHKVIYENGIFIPNAIIPDEIDSDVNQFRPVAVGLREYRLMIFDTFGNLIWEDSDLDFEGKPINSWKGDLNKDGNILKQDVYVWKVVGTFKNGNKINKTGTVTLIR
ncbi:MAG: PKD domain-containing protein, partial [Flavobacteriales bacterium]|nr:PKD domain-containing protein [Flavobacteriales bacterium]